MISKEFMEDYELCGKIVESIDKRNVNDEWVNDIEIVTIIDWSLYFFILWVNTHTDDGFKSRNKRNN